VTLTVAGKFKLGIVPIKTPPDAPPAPPVREMPSAPRAPLPPLWPPATKTTFMDFAPGGFIQVPEDSNISTFVFGDNVAAIIF
jgi:hypothetical protein